MSLMKRLFGCCAAFLLLAGAASMPSPAVAADNWPSRPVTMVVPYGPGSSNDSFTRALANLLSKKFGQPFVVENRAGASGYQGVVQVARAAPDGYTFLESPNAIASFKEVLKYDLDPLKDVQTVAMIARAPLAFVVPTSLPVNDVKGFIEYARARPDQTFYGIIGLGSLTRFMSDQFVETTGLKMKSINYKSAADGVLDLVAGRLHFMFQTPASVAGQVKGGQLKILAYTNNSYSADAPKAPLLSEQGVQGLDIGQSWWGIFAPNGVPPEIIAKMNAAINESLSDPSFVTLLATSGATAMVVSPAEFTKVLEAEAQLLGKIMREKNPKID